MIIIIIYIGNLFSINNDAVDEIKLNYYDIYSFINSNFVETKVIKKKQKGLYNLNIKK